MTQQNLSLVELRFGSDRHWQLPNLETLASCTNDVPAVVDLPAAISGALQSPLGLPSLDQVMVPGDIVALAIDPSLPSLGTVVGLVSKWLCERGAAPSNLRVVIASSAKVLADEATAGLLRVFAASGFDPADVRVESHDADDLQANAYVAANEASDPIYMNRTLVDADVVIPIVCARHSQAFDYLGAYSLFPLLSNRETQGMFFQLSKLEEQQGHQQLTAWADQAAWWLGLLAMIQVIPAAEDRVAGVVAGLIESVEEASQELLERLWHTTLEPAELVVALLDSPNQQQNWREVMRGLRTATRFTKPGGSIVVCTQLRGEVGRAFKRLADVHDSRETIARKLDRDNSDDALPAAVLLEATGDYHVYLASGLRASTVESMGLGVIESEEQLSHLIGQHRSWAVLGSAQHRF